MIGQSKEEARVKSQKYFSDPSYIGGVTLAAQVEGFDKN